MLHRLWQRGAETTDMARTLDGLVNEARYEWFGCPRFGLHVSDGDAAACRRCRHSRGELRGDRSGAWRFSDDRHLPYVATRRASMETTHVRWLDQHGRLHRRDRDRPALIAPTMRVWATDGHVRRDAVGLPSIYSDADRHAYTDAEGRLHREAGQAAIVWDSNVEYWDHGVLHRADGPAIHYRRGYPHYYRRGIELGSREDLWAHWVHDHAGIDLDNGDAQSFVAAGMGLSDDPLEAFPVPHADVVELALTLCPNMSGGAA